MRLESFDDFFLFGAVDQLDDLELLYLVDQEGGFGWWQVGFFKLFEPLDDCFEALYVYVDFEALVLDAEERVLEGVLHLALLEDARLVVLRGVLLGRLVRAGRLRREVPDVDVGQRDLVFRRVLDYRNLLQDLVVALVELRAEALVCLGRATFAPLLEAEEKHRRLLPHSFSRLEYLLEERPELPIQGHQDRFRHVQQLRVGEDAWVTPALHFM